MWPVFSAGSRSLSPLFAGFSRKDRRDIAQIAREANFDRAGVLCRQGDPCGDFYVPIDERVDVERDGESINTLRAGDFFSEVALITKAPRNATVTALDPVRALIIGADDFRDLLTRSHNVFLKVVVVLTHRVPPEPI